MVGKLGTTKIVLSTISRMPRQLGEVRQTIDSACPAAKMTTSCQTFFICSMVIMTIEK